MGRLRDTGEPVASPNGRLIGFLNPAGGTAPRQPIQHLPEYKANFGRAPIVSHHSARIGAPSAATTQALTAFLPNAAAPTPEVSPHDAMIHTGPGYGAFDGVVHGALGE